MAGNIRTLGDAYRWWFSIIFGICERNFQSSSLSVEIRQGMTGPHETRSCPSRQFKKLGPSRFKNVANLAKGNDLDLHTIQTIVRDLGQIIIRVYIDRRGII